MEALKNEEIDLIFPANFSISESERIGIALTPMIMHSALFIAVPMDQQTTFAEKKQVTAAVAKGDGNCLSILQDHYPGWDTVTCEDTKECVSAVADGRADCFLISSYRYNNLSQLFTKYNLTTLDTGKEVSYSFAVKEGNTVLYSILTKTTNIIPETFIDTSLSRYFSEDAQIKTTLLDFIRDNLLLFIAVIVVIVVMLMLIIVQHRLINAEKKAKEHRRIADDLSRRVYVDALTSVRNKGGYTDYAKMLQERLRLNEISEFAVCVLDCDDLKEINDKYGHEKGDIYLKTAARHICRIFTNSLVFRVGGDEFIIILQDEDYIRRDELMTRFEEESRAVNASARNEWEKVNLSLGMAVYDHQKDNSVEDTSHRADQLMYENKRMRKEGRKIR